MSATRAILHLHYTSSPLMASLLSRFVVIKRSHRNFRSLRHPSLTHDQYILLCIVFCNHHVDSGPLLLLVVRCVCTTNAMYLHYVVYLHYKTIEQLISISRFDKLPIEWIYLYYLMDGSCPIPCRRIWDCGGTIYR